jgi:hypothetical protein
MNVLVVNQQESVVSSLNVEIIKTLRGTFSADEIISTFTNFFFARMIIDITALQNSEDVVTYQKLSIGLPIDKIILLIPANSKVANNFFLSKLISMGYYNFTTNGDGILYLLNTPNTYKEVAHLHQAEPATPPPPSMPGPAPSNNGGYDNSVPMSVEPSASGVRTLGIKNVTDGAGSSSLIYMLKKELEERFNMSCLALEVDKREFAFFREKDMISVDKNSLASELIKARNFNYVLVDLNDYEDPICDDVIYLLEPSVIKLNKLMLRDRTIFSKLKDKKVIINKSTLSEADVKEFASEAGVKIFYVLPPINDRERSDVIANLLKQLGMV